MDSNFKKILYTTLAEVFETMFFSYLDEVEDGHILNDLENEVYMEAAIPLSGREKGYIRFYFQKSLAWHIGVNFLGIAEDEIEEKQIRDALGEAANMAVGSLLGKLDPQTGSTVLGLPTVAKYDGVTLQDIARRRPGVMIFSTQHGSLLLDCGVIAACFA